MIENKHGIRITCVIPFESFTFNYRVLFLHTLISLKIAVSLKQLTSSLTINPKITITLFSSTHFLRAFCHRITHHNSDHPDNAAHKWRHKSITTASWKKLVSIQCDDTDEHVLVLMSISRLCCCRWIEEG